MNSTKVAARRIACRTCITALLAGFFGCASEPNNTEAEMTPIAQAISAEDAVQIPIQVVSERERAAQRQARCGDDRTPGSRVVACMSGQ